MTDDREAAPPQSKPHRMIRDNLGRVWTVREIEGGGYDRRTSRSLVFERDEVIRRVRTYPDEWRTMSDADLYALTLRA